MFGARRKKSVVFKKMYEKTYQQNYFFSYIAWVLFNMLYNAVISNKNIHKNKQNSICLMLASIYLNNFGGRFSLSSSTTSEQTAKNQLFIKKVQALEKS